MGLCKNVGKKIGMIYCPFPAVGNQEIQAQDDGGGPDTPGPPETAGSVSRLFRGPGLIFSCGAPSNSSRHLYGCKLGDPHLPPCGGSSDVSREVSTCGGATGVPGRGVPGKGGNVEGVACALFAIPRAGQRYHYGGGKPPPPTVTLI